MNLFFYAKLYALTVPVFFALDMLWLGYLARDLYRRKLDFILSPDPNWLAAILFYLVYIVGILFFAVAPALAKDSIGRAALSGGLFGFFTYATYDLTNLATIRGWPISIVVVDVAWGTILCVLTAMAAFSIGAWLR